MTSTEKMNDLKAQIAVMTDSFKKARDARVTSMENQLEFTSLTAVNAMLKFIVENGLDAAIDLYANDVEEFINKMNTAQHFIPKTLRREVG